MFLKAKATNTVVVAAIEEGEQPMIIDTTEKPALQAPLDYLILKAVSEKDVASYQSS